MLIKGFYTTKSIVFKQKDTIHATIELNKDHDVFNGHFPNNPVTPGVCMLQVIKEIIQKHLNCSLVLQRISNMKFTALINPEINARLVIETVITKEIDCIKIKNITKFIDGTIALKCNGTYIKS